MRTTEQIKAEIKEKFGFVPPFFEPAAQAPQVLENLWQQTLSAYVYNPLSFLFKEKLNAYLSRFCAVPYCMVCHSCVLRPLGMTAQEVLELLESPPPTAADIEKHLGLLAVQPDLLTALPELNSALGESLFYCTIYIFLEGDQAQQYRAELRRILGAVNYQHLVAYVAYIKTCHTWIEAHPEISYEADKRAVEHLGPLLEQEPYLADFFRNYTERVGRQQQSRAIQLVQLAERKRNEEVLRSSEARLRLALEAAQMGTWDWDILTNNMVFSDQLAPIFGFPPGSYHSTYEAFLNFVHPKDRKRIAQAVALTLENGADYEVEFRVLLSDGTVHWVGSKGQVYYDKTGRAIRMVGVAMDITEPKQAEEQLGLLNSVVVNAKDAVLITEAEPFDEPGPRILYVNEAFTHMTGYSMEEVLGKTPRILQGPKTERVALDQIRAALVAWQPVRVEVLNYRKDGSEIWVDLSIAPVADKTGWYTHWISIQRDVTEQKQVEAEICNLNEELRQNVAELAVVNQELEAFSYSVSHDLRAPLRHINGFTDLLQKKAASTLDEKNRRYLKTISESAKRMGNLIDDLLAFSRMGRNEMLNTRVSLEQLIREVQQDLQPDVEGRDIVWEIDPLPEVQGDSSMLRLVIVNLIANAVKYTRTRVQAQIKIGCLPGQQDEMVFFIRDNGVGFDMQYANKLFGVFQRLHCTEEFEGTGIGLATIRRIIHRHGGRTWAEGVVEEGATFYFSLPKSHKG